MNQEQGMSLVVPFYNETEGISSFCKTVDEYAKQLSFSIEIVFVNDGSTDDTLEKVKKYKFENVKKVKLIDLSKNYGFHSACRAGLLKADFDVCTWICSDLQEPLEMLPISYQKIIDEGYDAVYIEKKTIKVSHIERAFSKAYSWLMKKYAVKNYTSGGTANIVFSRKVLNMLNDNIENNTPVMLQIIDAGYKTYTLSMDYKAREIGASKWTLSKKIKLFIDSFVSFSFMPIRLVSYVGILIFLIGVIIGIETIVNKIINPDVSIGYSTLACILAFGFGTTNISLGIIAEYLWRTYDAARKRPTFIISDTYILKDEVSEQE